MNLISNYFIAALNSAHFVLFILWFYGAYIFWFDYIDNFDALSIYLSVVLFVLSLGELWSLALLFGFLSKGTDLNLGLRLIQVVFQVVTLLYLIRYVRNKMLGEN